MLKPLDPVTKEWVQLTLDTLTSLGTIGVLIVALWLAQRERKEVVRARVGERAILWLREKPMEVINIEVTNLTSRPVTVRSLGWTVGIFRKRYFFQMHDWTDPLSSKLPTQLEYGAVANYNLPRDEFFQNAAPICNEISTNYAMVECTVHLPGGRHVRLSGTLPFLR
jgi:hypothetical protein